MQANIPADVNFMVSGGDCEKQCDKLCEKLCEKACEKLCEQLCEQLRAKVENAGKFHFVKVLLYETISRRSGA